MQVSVLVLKVNEVSFGIEVRGEDLTVALQAEELMLQQLGTMGLWQFLHGQCPGEDGSRSLTCSCHCVPRAAALGPNPWPFSPAAIGGRSPMKPPSSRDPPRALCEALHSVGYSPS